MIASCDCPINPHKRELKEHGSFAFPIACYSNNTQTLSVPWHWHDELEMLVIEQGSALVHIDSAKYTLEQGSGCFINAGVLHSLEKINNTDVLEHCIVFHPRLIGGSMDSIFWQKYVLPLTLDHSFPGLLLYPDVPWQQKILSHIQTAWEACAKEYEDCEITTRNVLSECLGILRQQKPIQQKQLSEKTIRQSGRMKTMLAFIQQHFSETISVSQIAASASVSESECMRCFNRTIGITPIQYLKSYRLQYAARLLKETDLPITSVGSHCGFQEMSYFSRSFRKVYGYTPSDYRKSKLQQILLR